MGTEDHKAAAKEAARKTFTVEDIEAGVESWLAAKVRNSPLSRDTEAWNYLVGVLPDLTSHITGN